MGIRVGIVFIVCWLLISGLFGVAFADDSNPKEIGAMWQMAYGNSATPNACTGSVLSDGQGFCENLRNVLINKGKWTVNSSVWEGNSAQASGIKSSGSDKADWVDLFVFSGHGMFINNSPDGDSLHFRTNHTTEAAAGCNVLHSECSWGQGDCEVVVTFSCNFLTNHGQSATLTGMKYMCQGVHIICGFASDSYTSTGLGTDFGIWLIGKRGWFVFDVTPQPVIDAWFTSCDRNQPSGTIAAALYHTSCRNDYMPGNIDWGSPTNHRMGNDPPPCTAQNLSDYVKLAHTVP